MPLNAKMLSRIVMVGALTGSFHPGTFASYAFVIDVSIYVYQ